MSLDELTPVVKELAGFPVAFLGGFVSGLLRLNLAEDPVKGWLDKATNSYTTTSPSSNGKSGPQSISIE
jgi:hypothetical protein